jgi:hypothetical protein
MHKCTLWTKRIIFSTNRGGSCGSQEALRSFESATLVLALKYQAWHFVFLVQKGYYAAWFEILTALPMNIKVFWDITPCQYLVTDVSEEAARPCGNWFQFGTASYPRRLSWRDVSYLSRPWSGLTCCRQPQLMCLSCHCHCLRLQTKLSTFYFIPGEDLDFTVDKRTENILRFVSHELVIISNCKCFNIVDFHIDANNRKKGTCCCVSMATMVR